MKLLQTTVMLCILSTSMLLAAPYKVIDDVGNDVILERPAARIISLAPHLTEILFAIGAGESVVGVSAFSNYPEEAQELPAIGGNTRIDLEQIISLQPDLIVAWDMGNPQRELERLEALGITIYRNNPTHLIDVAMTMQQLGRLTDRQQQAAVVAERYLQHYEAMLDRYRDLSKVTVFYQLWPQPIRTINQHSVISQIIELCGGENIFSDALVPVPQINIEAIFQRNPQVVLASDDQLNDWQQWWLQWLELQAVQAAHLYTVPADLTHRYGPRVLEGAEVVCNYLDVVRTAAGSGLNP